MTDTPDGSPPAGAPAGAAAVGPTGAGPTPGWYPDPWAGGRHRYWTGEHWTGDTFPDGPALPALTAPRWAAPDRVAEMAAAARRAEADWGPMPVGGAPPEMPSETTPPPPEWQPPARSGPWGGLPPEPEPPEPADGATPPSRLPTGATLVALLVLVGLIVGFLSVAGVLYARGGRTTTTLPAALPVLPAPTGPTVPGTTPSAPADPSASALSGLVVTQADVDPTVTVQPLANGGDVAGQTTLDLCNGTFASESLRTARLQVVAIDPQGNDALSTEAVLYSTTAATAQAFAELRTTAAACPAGPVVSPAGEPTVSTRFDPAPDAAWPQVTGVERLAFDFVTTDDAGQVQHSVAVYLRRGRVLMGIYFLQPDAAPPAVDGQTAVPAIVNVFATRMAQLPASVVNGG